MTQMSGQQETINPFMTFGPVQASLRLRNGSPNVFNAFGPAAAATGPGMRASAVLSRRLDEMAISSTDLPDVSFRRMEVDGQERLVRFAGLAALASVSIAAATAQPNPVESGPRY